jgi:hypothetical protein
LSRRIPYIGSMAVDPHPCPKGPLTVLLRHTVTYAVCPGWVGSRCLENSYLESVPTSELGTTTDIRRAPGHAHMIDSVLLGSAEAV